MKFLAFCLAMSLSMGVFADEIKLATITSDAVSDTTIFYLETNSDGSAQAMRYVTTGESGQVLEDIHHTLEVILEGGVTLREMEGREVVRLFLESFDTTKGGKVKLNYLANGVTGSRGNHNIQLIKKDGKFTLANLDGKVINKMTIYGNWSRILRRWIGVSSIATTFEVQNR
jgi:hypothetical protein